MDHPGVEDSRAEEEPAPETILAFEEGQWPWRFTMELVDQLLATLAGPNPGHASRQLMAAGYSEDEVRGRGISPGPPATPSRRGWAPTD